MFQCSKKLKMDCRGCEETYQQLGLSVPTLQSAEPPKPELLSPKPLPRKTSNAWRAFRPSLTISGAKLKAHRIPVPSMAGKTQHSTTFFHEKQPQPSKPYTEPLAPNNLNPEPQNPTPQKPTQTLNPKTLNPKAPHPKTLRPKTFKPPKTPQCKTVDSTCNLLKEAKRYCSLRLAGC